MSVPDVAQSIAAPSIKVKEIDSVGRLKAYGEGLIPPDVFRATCAELDRRCLASGGSRWAVRALVPRGARLSPSQFPLSEHGGPLEVNRLAVTVEGSAHDYLWVARNLHDRAPTPNEVDKFGAAVGRMVEHQENYFSAFDNHAASLLALVEERGLSLVCHDPLGEWGDRAVDPGLFASALHQLFFFSHDDAAEMAIGRGYSRHGHYVFGLKGQAGDVLAMFVLAQFDWGFEGTYTMVNSTLSPRETAGAARLLMLLANAMVLSRHGAGTLLYGEANVHNIKACISAGYEVVAPAFAREVHENVVWRDNPIGVLVGADPSLVVTPPGYREQPYVDYALMRARNEVVLPYITAAQRLLHT